MPHFPSGLCQGMNRRYHESAPLWSGTVWPRPPPITALPRQGLSQRPAPLPQPRGTAAAQLSPPRPSAPAGAASGIPIWLFPVKEKKLPPLLFAQKDQCEKSSGTAGQLAWHCLASGTGTMLSESSELPFLCPNYLQGSSEQLFRLAPALPAQKTCSGIAEGHPPPQPPTQAVFDPALLPLFHRSDFVW